MHCARWPLLALLLAFSAQADTTWRCASHLVSLGDRAFEVRQKCGEPIQRDVIGYALSPNGRNEVFIEEWLYGPNSGMYSLLRFEGNRLTKIERKR